MTKKITTFFQNFNALEKIILLFLFIVFCWFQKEHFFLDFWNDEIYTLKHFVFVPLSTTLSDYHVPNNHIFFNFLNNIYLKVCGVDNLYDLMDNPPLIRILPFLYSVGTLFYAYAYGKKFFNISVGFLSAVVLLSSIIFFNFALQIRGYSLSMLLLMMLFFYAMSYLKNNKNTYLIFVVILTALSFYTVPVNIYPILGGFSFFVIKGCYFYFKSLKINALHFIKIAISIAIGVVISFCFYLPMFQEVFFNEYVISNSFFNIKALNHVLPELWGNYISDRGLLNYLFLGGIISSFFARKSIFLKNENVLLLFVFFVPFFISFVRGEIVPQRALSMFIPIFSITIAVGVFSFFKILPTLKDYPIIFLLPITIYSFFIFQNKIEEIDSRLLLNLHGNHRAQNSVYNYYLGHFKPLEEVENFYNKIYTPSDTILIYGCERHGFPNYLEKYHIPYFPSEQADSVLASKKEAFYVVTNFPNGFKSYLANKYPFYEVEILKPELTYNNFLRLKYKSSD